MMKVMYLLDYYNSPYSGAESQLLKLVEQLNDRDDVQCSMTLLRSSQYIEEHGFPCSVRVLGLYRMLSFVTFYRLYKYAKKIKAEGYTVVHILLNDSAIFAPVFLKLAGLKVIVSRLDMGFWYSKSNMPLLRFSRFFVDKVLANGLAVKQKVVDAEKYKPDDVAVIYNGIKDTEKLASIEPVNIHEYFNFDAKDPIIGIVASLYPIKRIEDLISAVARVKESIPNIRLVSLGGGDPERYLALVNELNLSEHVFFAGAQAEPLNWISSFDVAALCSESEGFSNAIVEYLMCGIPVVCSNVGGNSEIVQQGVNGFLYECADIPELAGRLVEILSDHGLGDKLKFAASQSIGDQFTLKHFTSEHIKLYKAVQ